MVTLHDGTSLPKTSLGDFWVGRFELVMVRVFTSWKLATDTNESLSFWRGCLLHTYQQGVDAVTSEYHHLQIECVMEKK